MQKWVIGVLFGVIKEILTDDDTRTKLVDIVQRIMGGVIAQKVLPLIPTAIAGALEAMVSKIPNIPNLNPGEVVAVAEAAKDSVINVVDKAIPDFDTGIKELDDLMDFWRPKH